MNDYLGINIYLIFFRLLTILPITKNQSKTQLLIKIFEHQKLRLGKDFTQRHLDALAQFNDRHGQRYFKMIHKGIQFGSFVGVLQVGSITIEILPKADQRPQSSKSEAGWRSILLEMLQITGNIPTFALTNAPLAIRKHTILEIYIAIFLNEVERVLQHGLLSQYSQQQQRTSSLKGQLIFPRQIITAVTKPSYFEVKSQQFSQQHWMHQLLLSALRSVKKMYIHPNLSKRSLALFRQMEIQVGNGVHSEDVNWHKHLAQNAALVIPPRFKHYKIALDLARLIVTHHSPDLQLGHLHITAILLDMNVLFERYVFETLKNTLKNGRYAGLNIQIKAQPSRIFWSAERETTLRPDIFINVRPPSQPSYNIVLDTKWKLLGNSNSPHTNDLKQMFVYGQYFNAAHTFLVYPNAETRSSKKSDKPLQGKFNKQMYNETTKQMTTQTCQLIFVNAIKNGQLNRSIGEDILEYIIKIA